MIVAVIEEHSLVQLQWGIKKSAFVFGYSLTFSIFKVPGAMCVLQEAGETEVVLQIGERLLKERLPKSFKQDVVLAMALAYVDKSRDAMALTPPDFIEGSELLERALKLLQVNI